MAVYYVDSNTGIRTTGGGIADQGAVSFNTIGAASVYASIAAALADSFTQSDEIRCSHLHDHDAASSALIYSVPTTAGGITKVRSVDDATSNAYKPGATERNSSGTSADVGVTGGVMVATGMIFKTVDLFSIQSGGAFIGRDCEIHILNANNYVEFKNDGVTCWLYNTDIHLGAASSKVIRAQSGGFFKWIGGAVVDDSGASGIDKFAADPVVGGTFTAFIQGVDMSVIDGNSGAWWDNHGAGNSDTGLVLRMDHCKMNSAIGTNFFEEEMANPKNDILITRCTDDTTEVEYLRYVLKREGSVTEATNITRTSSTKYEETDQAVSVKAVTSSRASVDTPLRVPFPSVWMDIATASTDTLTIYVASATNDLKDTDLYFTAYFPDGTNRCEANWACSSAAAVGASNTITSSGAVVVDPFASGTALTSSAEGWDGDTTETLYEVELKLDSTAVGGVGADCVPRIDMCLTRASLSAGVYLATSNDIGAG